MCACTCVHTCIGPCYRTLLPSLKAGRKVALSEDLKEVDHEALIWGRSRLGRGSSRYKRWRQKREGCCSRKEVGKRQGGRKGLGEVWSLTGYGWWAM